MRLMSILVIVLAAVTTAPTRAEAAEGPARLIFDTDMCGDCDDVLALGMIHALESRGACRLLAVTVSVDHELAAPFVEAVNTFYGRGRIPVGVVGQGGVVEKSRFLALADQRDEGRLRFPRTVASDKSAPDATGLLRKALADQPDGSVVVVQVGFSTNLARLLDSKPDGHSPLSGIELVRKKCGLLSLMAGAFQPIQEKSGYKEYNVVRDISAARALAARWPTPRVWSGFEIGIALPYPHQSIERDFGYVAHHPVSEAYIRHNPPPHDRPTWDLTSVLQAVYPDRGYFDLSPPGTVSIEADGSNRFAPGPDGLDRYLVLKPEQAAKVTEALVQLASQPPSVGPREP